jgi:type II secretory pathway component PulF
MRALHLTARHRALLFRQLAEQGLGAGHWDQVFRLLDQGHEAAKRAQLNELAAQFEQGQEALLDGLRGSGRFLEWELEFLQIGLAAGDLRSVYLRLAEHYQRAEQFRVDLRRHCWLPLLLVMAAGAVLPVGGYLDGQLHLLSALLLGLLPAALLLGGYLLGRQLVQAGQLGRLSKGAVDFFYRLPGLGRLLAVYQTYHYFSNLSLCLAGGLSLQQGLRLAAQRLPYSPCRQRFSAVYQEVVAGSRLSDALRRSGILAGIPLMPVALGASAQDAQQHLTEATQAAFLRGLGYWGRWLPQFSLVLVPLVLAVNLLVML